MFRFIVAFVIVLAGLLEASFEDEGGNQFFIRKPENTTVHEHGDFSLECLVGDLKGDIQWVRNGFAMGLGQEMVALSCKKCSLLSPNRGHSILKVRDVVLGDGENFECQVSPGPKGPKVLLRAHVYVNVLVPPKKVKFEKPEPAIAGKKITVPCTASSSKPPTKLLWYKNDVLIQNAELNEETLNGNRNGTFTTISRLTIRPEKEDNGAIIKCVGEHPAISTPSEREFFQDKSRLNVLYPPERGPVIHGDLSPVRKKGEIIQLTCISHGGNPPSELYWEMEQRKINTVLNPRFRTSPSTEKLIRDGISKSILTFEATPSDNNVFFSCSSFSRIMQKSLHSENNASFVIEFPPSDVKITGPSSGRVGSLLKFNCTAFNGNPAPRIEWSLNGKEQVGASIDHQLNSGEGGYTLTSQISLQLLETDKEEILLSCSAISEGESGEIMKVNEKHSITVLKPPSQPSISGLPQSKSLREGEIIQLNCSSPDGSPRPRVAWYLGDSSNIIPQSVYSKIPIPHSMINLTASRMDNDRIYRCSALNDANVHKPSSTTINLQVFFPPDSVEISVERPQSPKSHLVQSKAVNPYFNKFGFRSRQTPQTTVIEGEFLRVICRSSSSKPRATVQWHVNGLTHKSQSEHFSSGEYGGTQTVSVIELKASHLDHGQIFECFARNIAISETRVVSTNLTLNVLYAPKFEAKIPEVISMVEGETRNISLSAIGNPSEIKYDWEIPSSLRGDVSRFIMEGPSIIIQGADRRDAGRYKITASNSYGNFTTSKSIRVNVQYAPSIIELTQNQTIEEHLTVRFYCRVDANPITDKTITWAFENQDPVGLLTDSNMRANTHMSNSTSTLTIISAHRGNTGFITCHAKNNISEITFTNRTYLTVNHKPWIFKNPTLNKFAIPKGDPAELICRSTGVPGVNFTWTKTLNDRTVTILPIDAYKGETVKPKRVYPDFRYTWDSVLRLDNVRPEYYSTVFTCIASNSFGEDVHDIHLVPRGKPDPPTNVRSLDSNHESVTLTWDPGFDGGYNQTYFVTVTEERTGKTVTNLLNVNKIQGNVTTILGLRPRTPYSFKITAKNKAGVSLPGGEVIKKTEAMEHSLPVNDGILSRVAIIGIIISVIIVFMVILVCVTCFIKQRKRRGSRRRSTSVGSRRNSSSNKDKSDNKSFMIERYTPSKYSSAMSDELFFPSGSFDKQRSNSVSSSINAPNYKELARSFSMPGPGSEEDTESSYNAVLPNGGPFSGDGHSHPLPPLPCTKHLTMDYRRKKPAIKGWRNLSQDDEEVFVEPHTAPRSSKGFFARQINQGFRSEEVGLPALPPQPSSSSKHVVGGSRFKPNGFIGGRRHHSGGYSLSSATPIFHPRRRESATPSPLPGVGTGGKNYPSMAYTLPRKNSNLEFTNPYLYHTGYVDDVEESSFYPPPRRRLPPPPILSSSSQVKSSDSLEEDDDSELTCPPPPPPPMSTLSGVGRRNYAYK